MADLRLLLRYLFAAALLHMTRGDKRTQLSVLTLVPKLMISVLLTIFAPTIMGGLIDFSNTFVSSIFTLDSARSVGRITDILAQSNTYLTGAGTLVTQLVQVIVGLFTDFFFAFFILGSLIRQLVLMALVMLAPLACFCILVPRWQPQFTRYVRVLLACIFLPAVMAFILKLGISLNPIVSAAANNSSVDGITGLIGLFMVMITLWLMAKAMKLTAAIATGNSAFTNSLTGRTMGKLGAAASMAGAAGVFGMGTASRALGAGAALGAASEGIGASLIPSGKSLAGGGSGGGLLGGGRRLGLPGAGGSSFGSEGDPSGGGRGLAARYEARLNQRMEGRGEQRIPQAQAQAYQKELAGAIAARESASGHRLSRGERDELMHGQLIRDDAGNIIVDRATGKTQRADGGFVGAHGALVERKGNSYLTKPETAAPKRVPGRIGQAVGAVTDVVQVPLAAVRAAGSTPVGGGVGRAGDRAIGAARVAATAARAGTTKVASGDIASLHSDQALAHSEDAAAASAALTANWGRREQTHALAGSVDEAAANPRAVARQARAAAPVPASPPPKPRRRARASVSSPLNDTKASKEDAPKLVP
jgi:hypothetical protein